MPTEPGGPQTENRTVRARTPLPALWIYPLSLRLVWREHQAGMSEPADPFDRETIMNLENLLRRR